MSGLVTTYQLRLPRGTHEDALERMSVYMGMIERHLHIALENAHRDAAAEIAAAGGIEAFKTLRDEEGKELQHPLQRIKNDIKVQFLRRFGITGRQYNSILRGLEGRHDSLREITKERIKSNQSKLSALEKKIAKRNGKIKSFAKVALEVDARAKRGKGPTKAQSKKLLSRSEYNRLRFAQHNQKRRAEILRLKIARDRMEIEKDIPSVTFGSKALLRKRSQIHNNDRQAIESWRRRWSATRGSGFLAMGSKDEAAGCQSCIGEIDAMGRLSLKVRLPDALSTRDNKYIALMGIDLPRFGADQIRGALMAHKEKSPDRVAISYRFVRDVDWPSTRKLSEWRICITIKTPVPALADRSFETYMTPRGRETTSATGITDMFRGAIGVDINADHLAWAVIDRFGNPLRENCGRIMLPLRGKTSGHRNSLIGEAARELVEIALRADLPLVLERLDFSAKKRDMSDRPACYKRMLSSFPYAAVQTAIRRRAAREGVELVDVNPAYTSLIGRVNYSLRYGLSVHISAAVSIARRAARFSERVNYLHGKRGCRGTFQTGSDQPNESRKHVWRQWQKVRKSRSVDTWTWSRLVTGKTTSISSKGAGKTASPGAGEMTSFDEDRLALMRLIS